MGIGGLDEQFIQILRRAFASRVFPPEVTEQLGVKHVKGLLLYGPPGMICLTCYPTIVVHSVDSSSS